MANLALSGIASGVDTASIVDQLMALERQSLTRLQTSQSRLTARDTGLKDIQSKLSALKDAAAALRAPTTWASKQTATSSDTSSVGAELISGAGIGGTSINVVRLANSTQRTFDFAASAAPRTITLQSSASGATPIDINVPANATLDDVVSTINARTDLPVFAASVVPAPGQPAQLVLSSRTTGAPTTATGSSGFTVTGDATTEVAAKYKAGVDAQYKLNGSNVTLSSPTNVIENAIAGVRLTLKGVSPTATGATINVSEPALDKEAAKAKVKAFVDAYNAVVTSARQKVGEKVVPGATTRADMDKGQLFGDAGLNTILSTMRTSISDAVGGNPVATDALADIGITTGAIGSGTAALSGTLTIDDAKLTKALEDPTAVRRLMGGISGSDGIAQRFESLVERYVGSTGAIDQRLKSSEAEAKRITNAMAATDKRLEAKEKLLKAQFAAMELALQKTQTQQSWLTGQLNALNGAG